LIMDYDWDISSG